MISSTATIVITLWLVGFVVAMLVKRSPEALCGWMLAGWLFLPQFMLDLPGLFLNKMKLITLATAFAAVVIDGNRRPTFRVSLVDLPVLGISVAAFGASLSNGLGAYDGFTVALNFFLIWALPWYIGRSLFATPQNAKILAQYTVAAALVYVPFCLFEMKMAPVLHSMVYGYAPRGSGSMRVGALRFGLWRPMVFQETGLQLSMFMGISSILAFWGALTHSFRHTAQISAAKASAILAIVTLLCVSSGAIILSSLGWCIVFISRRRVNYYLLTGLSLIPVLYPVYRMTNIGALEVDRPQHPDGLFADRQASLQFRIKNENSFLDRWKHRPILGWTSTKYRFAGSESVPDSLWIQILCKFGLVGWTSLTTAMVLPLWRVGQTLGRDTAPGRAEYILAVCVLIFMLDCMFNAMECPVYLVMAGAAVTVSGRDQFTAQVEPRLPRNTSRVNRSPWPPLVESS